MKVWVDRTVCENHGQCTAVAPENFSMNKDGVMEYEEAVSDDDLDSVEDAVDGCPVQAIFLMDE
ncbi:ferredoxin [Garicola koreensis]|uniref:Ferredoxin n=1 Tax=Garicola koreensis TaxID=1262554 RepID=A0A7W5TPX9_9MICC|nr:ferredoxin [Garicola koreensis]MBB3667545.1 ferredoxin [Garicola koreensis]